MTQTIKSVWDMTHEQFKAELANRTTPQLVFDNAPQIYGFLAGTFQQDCSDSVMREWAFQWATDLGKIDYEVIYQKWLNG
jgi:hypothetical protein